MIESGLDPAQDGSGGGYGNYPGLTVTEIAARFRVLAEEGHNRSVRGVLRIVHEQTAARGTLGVQRIVAALGVVAIGVLGILREFASPDARGKVTLYLGAAMIATVLFAAGALSVEKTRARNAAQVDEIRRLALLALERIVEAPGFHAKPLEREHLRSFGELKGVDAARWSAVRQALGIES